MPPPEGAAAPVHAPEISLEEYEHIVRSVSSFKGALTLKKKKYANTFDYVSAQAAAGTVSTLEIGRAHV